MAIKRRKEERQHKTSNKPAKDQGKEAITLRHDVEIRHENEKKRTDEWNTNAHMMGGMAWLNDGKGIIERRKINRDNV